MSEIRQNRLSMHCPEFKKAMDESDQQKGLPHPPQGNVVTGELIELPYSENVISQPSYSQLLDIRRSERVFSDAVMTKEHLAFLLWSTQGVQDYRGANNHATLRPTPSGGARHPFELYCVVSRVEGLKPGLYRYAPLEHVGEKRVSVEYMGAFENYEERITEMMANQKWASKAPVVLIFTCVPYRSEWRYTNASHRVALIDLGHAGQNTMLSATALGIGSCCIAAYNQELCDAALGVNGIDEYTVYAIPVGAVK